MHKALVALLLASAITPIQIAAQDQTATTDESKQATTPVPTETKKKPAGLANPASVNCEEKGGTLEIRKGKKGEYGVCKFANGRECEEWAFFRGKCSPETGRMSVPSPEK